MGENVSQSNKWLKNMQLRLTSEIASNYSSAPQKIRVLTESWVGNSIFCPNCGSALNRFENNSPVADFYCNKCSEEYELKSKNGEMGKKIVDGAYSTMIERLKLSSTHFMYQR